MIINRILLIVALIWLASLTTAYVNNVKEMEYKLKFYEGYVDRISNNCQEIIDYSEQLIDQKDYRIQEVWQYYMNCEMENE